ncbi:MAG: AraC family transcriptional regulator [Bacteroidaceae bacterium]|nr:AraC family transcriptional regulator [Bacteroidaceae bacterium]
MDIQDLKPRRGDDTYRIGDSDELVVMENIGTVPSGVVCLQNHGVLFFITEGRAQLEYDGHVVQIQKNDLFLYMVHSTANNFMASSDFNCRQIWFSRSELWNIDIYNLISVADMSQLKLHPVVHLSDDDIKLCDTYFQLLCSRMKSSTSALTPDIVRSLSGTIMLELLSIMRRNSERAVEEVRQEDPNSSLHKKRIIDNFIKLVEESDGRIRRVDEFACQLNITPKYLSTILKEVMNRRPSTYIQLYTLKAIERRLRFTDMTMQEIANDLNFPNPSFFGKYCKEHLGMTPLEYRMKYHKGT